MLVPLEKKRILIFGSSGMLGKQLLTELSKDYEVISPRREDCDFSQRGQIKQYIETYFPKIVINAAAFVNINSCEQNKDYTYKVNSLSVLEMALACNSINAKLIHISTDHYYVNGYDTKHKENNYVTIVNQYAYTKFIAESYAALASEYLVLRTNIIGFKQLYKEISFLDWAVHNIINQKQMKLFTDYYTSPIDIYHFSYIIVKAIRKNICGLYNLAGRDVISKAQFIMHLSKDLGFSLNNPDFLSVKDFDIGNCLQRATSNGLDVDKIEKVLNCRMPNINQVVHKICEVYYDSYT